MSETAPPPGRAPIPLRCPRCGANVAPEQDWCLECGAPARTRLAPTPNWRLPVAAVVTVVLLAGLALAVAFTSLTHDDGAVTATATVSTAPAQPNEGSTQTIPTAPPVAATAPASSSTPGK